MLLLLLIAPAVSAEEHVTFEGLWQEANGKPDHRIYDLDRAIRIDVPSDGTIYIFSKPGRPEHPGVYKRSEVHDGPRVQVQMHSWWFGEPWGGGAFDKMVDELMGVPSKSTPTP